MTITVMLRRLAATTFLGLLVIAAGSCGALDVSDPTAIEDAELDNASGAELLRKATLRTLYEANGWAAYESGLMADEFTYALRPSSPAIPLLDRRDSEAYGRYTLWHTARTTADVALPKLRRYAVTNARFGEVLAARGYATLKLAEDYCPGFPLHDVADYAVSHTPPLSTEEVLERALADFDSAVVYAVDSARILNLARVFRGRTLLGLGRFAEAATAVQEVPTDFRQNADHSSDFSQRNWVALVALGRQSGVSNLEGGVGLDFVDSDDPRLRVKSWGIAWDGVTTMYYPVAYAAYTAPMPLASGIEARLIEAEAALHGAGQWREILNALRATVPGLAPLDDPGTDSARVDLLFRERAFWLFGTGHRLPDLRRLISHYGRGSETVFPTGAYWMGGGYGTATSLPFDPALEQPHVPAVTGCTG